MQTDLLPELSVRPMLIPLFQVRPLGKETKCLRPVGGGGDGGIG